MLVSFVSGVFILILFFFPSRRRHTSCALVTGVQTCALPIYPARWSHIRVATKYPEITRRHFAARGVQAECIKLNGAMELAPQLGLCRRIVDLEIGSASCRERVCQSV